MAPVCAQMAGMGNTVHWKVVLETAMAMVPAACQTTSRGGNVCARVDGMELDDEGLGLDDRQVPDDMELGDKVHDPPRRIRQ